MCVRQSDTCDHEPIMSENSYVCSLCGLVLEDQIYYGVDIATVPSNDPPAIDPLKNHAKIQSGVEDLEFLINLCHNSGLPEWFANDSHQLFKQIKSKVLQSEEKRPRSFKAILLSCFYYTLQKNQSSFTLKEIVAYSGVPAKEINAAFANYIKKSITLSPSEISDRFCAKLNLPKELAKIIKETLQSYELQSTCSTLSPSTIAGGVIYFHCRDQKLGIKLKTVSEVVGVSTVSITRFIRRYSLQ